MTKIAFTRVLFAISAAAVAAACSTRIGGTGQLSNGTPLSGSFFADMENERTIVDVVSPLGWQCQSIFEFRASDGKNPSRPMTCSNGVNGVLTLSQNGYRKGLAGTFRLDNGLTGQLTFDFQ